MIVLEVAVGVFIALVADRGLGGVIKARADQEANRQKRAAMKEAMGGLTDLLEKIKADHEHDERLEKALEKATAEVKKGSTSPLTTRQYAAIEKRFHEITGDHYIKLSRAQNGKADVTFSDQPFAKAPARKPATKKAPVKKSVAKPTAKKPVTKKGK